MNHLNILSSAMYLLVAASMLISCKKDQAKPEKDLEKTIITTDAELYSMAKDTNGFMWFNNSTALLTKSSGSGHNFPFLKTRYNATAAQMLESDGKIKSGSSFPEGSLIVKELYSDASTIGRYAILYKQTNSSSADNNGWVWGYINADGVVAAAASSKGNGCISCHTQSGHIDYMLMNKYFP